MRSNRRRNWFIKRFALGLAIAAIAAPVAQAKVDEGSSVQANGYQAFVTDFPSPQVNASDYGMPRAMPVDYAVNRGDQIELVRSQPRSTGDSFVASDYGMPRALPADYALASGDQIEVVRALPRHLERQDRVRPHAASVDRRAAGRRRRLRLEATLAIGAGLALGLVLLGLGRRPGDAPRRSRRRPPRTRRDGRQVVSGPQGPLTTASASISTSQRESSSPPARSVVFAGRILSEDLSVGAADALEVVGPHQVDAGADDVRERGARLLEGGADDLEAAPGLAVGVLGRIGAVGHDGRGAGHVHVLADADCAGEADDGLVR